MQSIQPSVEYDRDSTKGRAALETSSTEQTHLVHLAVFATYSKILGRKKFPRSTLAPLPPSGSDPGRLAERNLEVTTTQRILQLPGMEGFRTYHRDHGR